MHVEPVAKILIVDDEPGVGRILQLYLSAEGYSCAVAASGEEALEVLSQDHWDLVVSDIMMPGISGIELLSRVKDQYPDVAMIMVTGVNDNGTGLSAVKNGAYGYITKPFERNELIISVAGALERRRLLLLSRQYEQSLEQEVLARTARIREREYEIVMRLMSAMEFRDIETGGHIRRIGLYSAEMAKVLGWTAEAVADIQLAAAMHDIGKIGIPDRILRKPGSLNADEWKIMKEHTRIGTRILGRSDIPVLKLAKEIALSHHERWDGRGYPEGLAGEAIPESARIVAVADVYDALVNERRYKAAFPEEKALAIMLHDRGTHFDPRVLDCFMGILARIRQIAAEVTEEVPLENFMPNITFPNEYDSDESPTSKTESPRSRVVWG
jgi:putative two-component system response regulator